MDTTGVAPFDEEGARGHEFGRHADVSREGDDGDDTTTDAPPAVIVASVRLSGGPLALSESLAAISGASVQPNHHTVARDGERSLVLSIVDASVDEVEAAFAGDSTVEGFQAVQSFPDRLTYRVALAESAVLIAPTSLELGSRTVAVEGRNGEWHADFQFPDRESLVTLRAFCEANDISFTVNSLSETEYPGTVADDLSESQRETLKTAYESGYFDVPREFSQTELAEELGISTSAVSDRLRRATAQLIEERFGSLDRREGS
ncbi:helix-turn-helix domain-containing protein (plasmid) [Halorarum halophilum]|uniref:Helix-turn-helix domain-containing protein n=1 Tax=Halorarum halophilum TaxID=2743090 RepID=A0A7D5KI40_9EURY|nr:helix-turn-helix domain-containing protein [Halobaculum halophilum]QLG29736.1 helix-turn-helix domain-containing protein [Halobaculum halophilum]